MCCVLLTMKITATRRWKIEACLRASSALLLFLTALLIGIDHQKELLFNTISKEADFRSLDALYVVVWLDASGAAYNLIQLIRSVKLPDFNKNVKSSDRYVAWGIYLLDQMVTYTVVGGNLAALQGSLLAVTGNSSLQWMKLCNTFTRFCEQVGVSLVFGIIACFLMIITTSMSAFALFRLYSPHTFLMLKPNF